MIERDQAERVLEAASKAAELIDEGVFGAVVVVGIYRHGRGYKFWSVGDEKATDPLHKAMVKALPLPVTQRIETEMDDGA